MRNDSFVAKNQEKEPETEINNDNCKYLTNVSQKYVVNKQTFDFERRIIVGRFRRERTWKPVIDETEGRYLEFCQQVVDICSNWRVDHAV